MSNYLFIGFTCIFSLVFARCTDPSGDNSEVVSLDEFLPKSENEYNYEEDTTNQVEETVPDSIELLILSKIRDVSFVEESEQINKKHFPDRLDYSQRFYHELIIDSVLHELVVWEFEDSIHTVNAFYNWLDCFGQKCKSIRIGENKWIYDGAFQLYVDDLKLIFISSNENLNLEEWNNIFQPEKKKTWNYRLIQPLKRKTKWVGLEEEN